MCRKFLVLLLSFCILPAYTEEIDLATYIARVIQNDKVFEEILFDNMILQHRKTTLMPASDLIAEVKSQYYFYLDQNRNSPELSFSLDKLFAQSATTVSLSYSRAPEDILGNTNSSIQLSISQPIARNAFGRDTRLLEKIIETGDSIIRYQVVEAYEDYLASLINSYYNWYSAYENLKVSQASYDSSQKLLDNIKKRQRQNIALPVDVNKIRLLVLNKQEDIVNLTERFTSLQQIVSTALRTDDKKLIPKTPNQRVLSDDFQSLYKDFKLQSRTHRMFNLFEKQENLDVKRSAHALLPSTDLLLAYRISGEDWPVNNKDNSFFAGFSINWNIDNAAQKARLATKQIEQNRTSTINSNRSLQLRSDLFNIFQQIQREKQLISIAQKKIKLARSILAEEDKNYSYGKLSLNDYLDAVNRLDENRFNEILHSIQLNKLVLEWLRLTDKLIDKLPGSAN